jgi:protein SCO1
MIRRRRVLISLLCLLMTSLSTWSADIQLPTDSIYQLDIPLTNQDGKPVKLIDHRGKPLLISMFYTGCQFVCPRIIDALKKTEGALSPAERKNTTVLMVTFDPDRDDVAALKTVMVERNLDARQWTLARTDDRNVRKLAATLGIQYRALPSGDFNHTSVLILLDAEGRIVAKTSTIGGADKEFVGQAKKVVQQVAPKK